jgi:molybdate-binding protein/DNA-binding XRE family transcriptional regulator
MQTVSSGDIGNNVAALRQNRRLSAATLAKLVGISRQTIYAVEAGTYVPNTAVALRLARVLEVSVEELFHLPNQTATHRPGTEQATLLPGGDAAHPDQAVQLCRVGDRLIASAPSPVPWCLPPSDALVTSKRASGGRSTVQPHHSEPDLGNRILFAGCDPAISLVARYLLPANVELVLAHRNSAQALTLLKQGIVHIAGTHLRDEASGESNVGEIGRMFPKDSVALISYAVWEEGILTARANPKKIRGVEDLARKDVRLINREAGSGSRRLLDANLTRCQIDSGRVRGYADLASGHLSAAGRVHTGAADCCIATRAAARAFGLGFIPLVRERYDLAIHRQHLDLPPIQALLDTLNRARFRRELESTGGYDAGNAGTRLL